MTDRYNSIRDNETITKYGNIEIGGQLYVDDIMDIGSPENAKKAIRNLREMEIQKKFRYSLKKTKYMIIKTGREPDVEIKEKVEEGYVTEAESYKYLGLYLNQKGNLQLHIQKIKEKIYIKILEVTRIASRSNVGSEYINMRIKLYESTIVPSILYNLEAWVGMSEKEIEELESIQGKILRKLLELMVSTSYKGILMEIGIWPTKQIFIIL